MGQEEQTGIACGAFLTSAISPDAVALLDFPSFASTWNIFAKSGKLVQFVPNPAQTLMLRKLELQRLAGKPGRLRVLKYRQAGCSLLWIMYLLHQTLTRHGCTAISIADKLNLPEQWIRMCILLIKQIKVESPPHVKASSAHEIYLDQQHSRYHIGSAEGQTPGMGETIQVVHCSECASWRDPDALLGDLLPAVPPGPDTLVIQESTGRSVGDWWYQRYFEARRGIDEEGRPCAYEAVFLPWYIQPEYSLPNRNWEELGEITDREKQLISGCDQYRQADGLLISQAPITPGQVAWRRYTIASEFHGDDDLFANQYPANETEAFLAGGLSVFNREQIEHARETVRKPVWVGDVLIPHNPINYHLHGNASGDLLIWEHPDKRYHYVLGADCQWGTKDTADFDVLYVECLETSRVCAKMRGRYDLAHWGKYIAAIGYHYRTCPVAPERNADASDALMPLLLGNVTDWRYPNVWVRTDDISLRGHRPQDYGWLTTQHTKGEIIAFAKSASLDGSFDWADSQAVDEMEAYIRDDKGKLTAPKGNYDDCLMARMITAYVAHRQRLRGDLWKDPEPVRPIMVSPAERLAEMIGDTDDDAGEEGDAHE